ncbi:MAG: sugar transporter substrate-binding protein [Myxococcales bacterium]|nr:sugar transporter substrate-binding protein [Myxococcales bacterium]
MIAPLVLATQLVVWHSYRADEQRAFEACVQEWNRAHHDVHVEALALPHDGYASKLEAAIPRGNGPDLFVGSHDALGDWARAGVVTPIEGLVPAGSLTQFLDGTVAPLRVGGHLYGLPLAFKTIVLFYRTDLIATPPANTDELMKLARATRAASPGHYALAYEAGDFFYHAAWLHGFGGHILDAHDRPALSSEPSVAALAFVRTMADEELLPSESTSVVATQLFNDGRAAMTIKGPWFLGDIAQGVPFGVAPLPVVSSTGQRAAPLVTVEALLLAARAHDPKAALAFGAWLAGPESARIRATRGRQTVAARAAWDDPEIAADPILAAFRTQLSSTVATANVPAMNQVWEPANEALRKVLRGAAEPRAALGAAERKILEALRPPPPPVRAMPYAFALALAGVGAAIWTLRRGRARLAAVGGPGHGAPWAYLAPAATAMLVLVFVPFVVGAGMSLFWHDAGHWTFIGLRNFTDILSSRDAPITDPLSFYFTLAVTALWTVANVTLHVVIGVTLALLLRDPMLRLRGVYRVLLIVPWAVPNYITALIWKGMFHRQFGAVNGILVALHLTPVAWFSRFWTSFTANVVTNVWLGFPFMMVVTLGALSRIPKELEEAAALDGASRWQRLRYVILPLLRPALLPSVLLGAIWTFNMFNIVFFVSGGEPDGATDILVSQAYRWAFTRGHRYGYAAAYAVIIFIILGVQTMLTQRRTEEAT